MAAPAAYAGSFALLIDVVRTCNLKRTLGFTEQQGGHLSEYLKSLLLHSRQVARSGAW